MRCVAYASVCVCWNLLKSCFNLTHFQVSPEYFESLFITSIIHIISARQATHHSIYFTWKNEIPNRKEENLADLQNIWYTYIYDESHPVNRRTFCVCVWVCSNLFVCLLKLKHSFFILFEFRIWYEHYYKVLFSIQSHFIWKMNRTQRLSEWVSDCVSFFLILRVLFDSDCNSDFIVSSYSSLLLSTFVAFLRISVDR